MTAANDLDFDATRFTIIRNRRGRPAKNKVWSAPVVIERSWAYLLGAVELAADTVQADAAIAELVEAIALPTPAELGTIVIEAPADFVAPVEAETAEPELWPVLDPFGPKYPALPAVNKYRAKAKRGQLDQDGAREYGAAVHQAIRDLQRAELQRELRTHACPCASGTWHSEAKDILRAIRNQNRSQKVPDLRTDKQLVEAYEAAMAEKRAREAVELQAAA